MKFASPVAEGQNHCEEAQHDKRRSAADGSAIPWFTSDFVWFRSDRWCSVICVCNACKLCEQVTVKFLFENQFSLFTPFYSPLNILAFPLNDNVQDYNFLTSVSSTASDQPLKEAAASAEVVRVFALHGVMEAVRVLHVYLDHVVVLFIGGHEELLIKLGFTS